MMIYGNWEGPLGLQMLIFFGHINILGRSR